MRILPSFLVCIAAATSVSAQDTLPPSQGGLVHSLGLPEIYKPYAGVGLGVARAVGPDHLASQARLGVFRDIGSPVRELLGVPVWLEEAVPVRDEDAVPVSELLGVPVRELLGVPLWLELDVPVRDDDAVPECELLGVPVRELLGVPV